MPRPVEPGGAIVAKLPVAVLLSCHGGQSGSRALLAGENSRGVFVDLQNRSGGSGGSSSSSSSNGRLYCP